MQHQQNTQFLKHTHTEYFMRITHMLSHKTSVNKCKKIEIIPSIISDHNGMKLATNYRRKTRNFTNMWTSNNTLKQPMDENGNQKGNLRIS